MLSEPISKFFSWLGYIIYNINSIGLSFFGYTLGLFDIIFSFVAISIVFSLFWKGGRG